MLFFKVWHKISTFTHEISNIRPTVAYLEEQNETFCRILFGVIFGIKFILPKVAKRFLLKKAFK